MAGAQWQVAALLALTWTLTLLYGEWLQYSLHAPLCRDLLPQRSEVRRMRPPPQDQPFTVAILATPQLEVSAGRALFAHQIRSDLQLRRKFRASILARAAPNVVVVLGDLFATPLPLTGQEWETSLSRYRHVFNPVVKVHGARRSLRKKKTAAARVLQIPGPTDVVQGSKASDEYFGQFSDAFSLDLNFVEALESGFSLMGINSAAAEGNASAHHTSTFWSFVEHARSTGKDKKGVPAQNLVLSPVPIFSPLGSSCLSLRHSNWVHTDVKKELSQNSTMRLISSLRPLFFVTGGHEGETCWQAMQAPAAGKESAASHKANFDDPQGNTLQGGQVLLGSFNPQRSHASSPFLLLSVAPAEKPLSKVANAKAPPPKLAMQLCITPSQYGLVLWYYLLVLISIASFILTPPRGPLPLDELRKGLRSFRDQFKAVKLKTENGETDYIEVVDAEGNMFLAPRIVAGTEGSESAAASSASQRESGPQHRSKHPQKDLQTPSQNDPHSKANPSAAPQGGPKPPLGWVPPLAVIRSRLLSAAGPVAVLLGCQLALYLGLLASDWA